MNVLVIGTSFMDCKGHASYRYDPVGRNIGSVNFVQGGVGRNVAVNMAHLGIDVTLLSSVDDSALGRDIIETAKKEKINTDNIGIAKSNGMGLWLAVMDQNGELVSSISQMPDFTEMEKIFDKNGEKLVKENDCIALEIDLSKELIEKVLNVAEKYNKKVYALPSNMETILNNRDFLSKIECFICNDIEAGRLFEIEMHDLTPAEILEIIKENVNKIHLPSLIVTLAEKGSVYYDTRTKESGICNAVKAKVIDSSGAGDSYFSATVTGLLKGMCLEKATKLGAKVAAFTVENEAPVCDYLPKEL
ncbi:MAG: carbohydrate kinase family protein [Synergistaceae bacterium]